MTCKNCDAPTEADVCPTCYRDPATNNCTECGKHLEGINYPYVCGACLRRPWQAKADGELFLGWGDEPWFQLADPQAAWDACPDGRKLLWVLGKRSVDASRACALLACQVRPGGLEHVIVEYTQKLYALTHGKPAPGRRRRRPLRPLRHGRPRGGVGTRLRRRDRDHHRLTPPLTGRDRGERRRGLAVAENSISRRVASGGAP